MHSDSVNISEHCQCSSRNHVSSLTVVTADRKAVFLKWAHVAIPEMTKMRANTNRIGPSICITLQHKWSSQRIKQLLAGNLFMDTCHIVLVG